MVCYDGAKITARSFADLTRSTNLLIKRLSNPAKMLTLRSNQALLTSHTHSDRSRAAPRKSLEGTPAASPATGNAVNMCQPLFSE